MSIKPIFYDISFPDSPQLWKRLEAIVTPCMKKVDDYIQKNGIHWNQPFNIFPAPNPFSLDCRAFKDRDGELYIEVGPLLLIDPTTIPEKFRTDDFNKLNDEEFINEFITWANDKYFKKDRLTPKEEDRTNLKFFFMQACNPELFNKYAEFVTAHEFAHHFCNHTQIPKKSELNVPVPLVFAALTGIFGNAVAKRMKFKVSSELLGNSIGLTGAFCLYWSVLLHTMRTRRIQEQEADVTAAKFLGNIDGAIYRWKAAIQFRQYLFNRSAADKQKIIGQYVNYWRTDHPTKEERIASLEAFQRNLPIPKLGYFEPSVPFKLMSNS